MTIAVSARVSRRDGFIGAMVGDRQVLLDIEGGSYIGLDGIGSDIWKSLEQPLTVDALCDGLSETYDGERSTIETDVIRFLDSLLKQNMITVAP